MNTFDTDFFLEPRVKENRFSENGAAGKAFSDFRKGSRRLCEHGRRFVPCVQEQMDAEKTRKVLQGRGNVARAPPNELKSFHFSNEMPQEGR